MCGGEEEKLKGIKRIRENNSEKEKGIVRDFMFICVHQIVREKVRMSVCVCACVFKSVCVRDRLNDMVSEK